MALPNEILSDILRTLVSTWIPELGKSLCRKKRGWLCLLWTCSRTRAILYNDKPAWALAYCHLPSQIDMMKASARGCLLSYVLTPSIPALNSSWVPNSWTDNARIDRIRRNTEFNKCWRIVLDRRGNVYDHIESLAHLCMSGISLKNLRELCLIAPFADDTKLMELTE